MVSRVRVTVFESQLNAQFAITGDVGAFMSRFRTIANNSAKALIPARTGELRRAQRGNIVPRSATRTVNVTLYNNARHAEWVHGGTVGPIRPKRGRYMILPPGGGHGRVFATSVRGQAAQEWLPKAVAIARRITGA
jgi:hypothetical protein